MDTVTIFRCSGFRPALCPSQGPSLEEHFPTGPSRRGPRGQASDWLLLQVRLQAEQPLPHPEETPMPSVSKCRGCERFEVPRIHRAPCEGQWSSAGSTNRKVQERRQISQALLGNGVTCLRCPGYCVERWGHRMSGDRAGGLVATECPGKSFFHLVAFFQGKTLLFSLPPSLLPFSWAFTIPWPPYELLLCTPPLLILKVPFGKVQLQSQLTDKDIWM